MSLLSSIRLRRRTQGATGQSALLGSLGRQGCAAIQRDPSRQEKWDGNVMKFKKRKCKVLHLDRNNSMHQNMLGPLWLEGSSAERVLEILLSKMTVSQESAFVAKVSGILGLF